MNEPEEQVAGAALATTSDQRAALARLEEGKLLLHVCARPEDAKAIRDQAEAIRVWARARRGALETECTAAELRVRAERRIGELLPPDDYVAGPGRGHRGKVLPEGRAFSWKAAHQFRLLASFLPERFEAALAELVKSARPATTAELLRLLRGDSGAPLRGDVPPPGMSPEAHVWSQCLGAVNQLVPIVVRGSNEVAVRPDVREELRRLLPQVLALKKQFATGFRQERRSS